MKIKLQVFSRIIQLMQKSKTTTQVSDFLNDTAEPKKRVF